MAADRRPVAQFRVYRTSRGVIVWRLVASNNRVLGVSATGFPAVQDAITAIRAVRDGTSTASIEVLHVPDRDWTWRMHGGGDTVIAVSYRSYKRRIDCRRATERFAAAAPYAEVDPAVGRRGRFWSADQGVD
ncbi:YegP family protein [Polymorphospora rubra]|uniref:YegP family protein n=1 Tax=Polymorphospora rubra TaxID=338584 RepID=UPI003411B16A